MFDSNSQEGETTACRLRGPSVSTPTQCPLRSTSRTTVETNRITNWAWTVRYTYQGQQKTLTQNSGTVMDLPFYEFCGAPATVNEGESIPLSVSLTVTDSNGVSATATSGSGVQPALVLVTYTCS
jgi:hypothetical protein